MHILAEVELHSVPDSMEPLLYVHIDAFSSGPYYKCVVGVKNYLTPFIIFKLVYLQRNEQSLIFLVICRKITSQTPQICM